VALALQNTKASDAVSLVIAEQYVKAFGELAQKGNTLLLPANAGDVSGMVAQALTIYQVPTTKTKFVAAGESSHDLVFLCTSLLATEHLVQDAAAEQERHQQRCGRCCLPARQ
jgi:hypothetical protein